MTKICNCEMTTRFNGTSNKKVRVERTLEGEVAETTPLYCLNFNYLNVVLINTIHKLIKRHFQSPR